MRSLAEADSFTPHFGGALANVAVAAARAGGRSALAGAAGDDEWGRWLRDRLERERVDLTFFELLAGEQTPIAFASFDESREPSFQIYGDAIKVAVASLAPRVDRGGRRRDRARLQLDDDGDPGRARRDLARP